MGKRLGPALVENKATHKIAFPSMLDGMPPNLNRDESDEEAYDLQAQSKDGLDAITETESDVLIGRSAEYYGGADGKEDTLHSYLHDIRGLSLLTLIEELTLAKLAATSDLRTPLPRRSELALGDFYCTTLYE
jgi:hypothetical protein